MDEKRDPSCHFCLIHHIAFLCIVCHDHFLKVDREKSCECVLYIYYTYVYYQHHKHEFEVF